MAVKKIDKMSMNELRTALRMDRACFRAIAETCALFASTAKSEISVAELEAIGEHATTEAGKYE